MAEIVFKIVAVLLVLGGGAGTAFIVMASAMGSVTNYAEAEKTIRWALVPAAVFVLGIYLAFKAF